MRSRRIVPLREQNDSDKQMRVYFLHYNPIETRIDADIRKRMLYGDDVIWLRSDNQIHDQGDQNSEGIGAFWAPKRVWTPFPKAAQDLAKRVERFRKNNSEGVLIVRNYQLASGLLDSTVKFVFDPMDSMPLFYKRRARALLGSRFLKALNSLRFYVHYSSLERRIALRASVFLTTGRADEAYIRKLSPKANVLRIGNGTSHVDNPPVSPRDDGQTIGFHGRMTWEPNHMTAERLAGSIATKLANYMGAVIRIRIGGRPVSRELLNRDRQNGVEICGFVEDLRAWMASLSLYVMPMYMGAGVKNKLIEALALGVPVLTNPLGAEDIPEADRGILHIAENDETLVRTIPRLLADRARLDAMRRDGRAYAERHFRWDLHRNSLMVELSRLKASNRL